MKKRSGLSCLVVFAIASMMALAGCGSSAPAGGNSGQGASSADGAYPKVEIKLSHVAAENTPKGQSALKFKEIVESKSGGNIKVKVFPSGQLYGDNDEIEALMANNVQIIVPSAAKLSGYDKTFEIFDLPFLFKDEEALRRFEDGEGGKKLLSKLESRGIKGLAFWPNGFKHITNNKAAIKHPADLKGLKIRTHGGQIINEVYEKMGAASTKIAFNEVYQALQLGTVDGQENSLVNIETQKYEEVQNNLTLTNHARSEYVVIANKQWWDSLDAKTQSLLDEAMKEATKVGRDLVQKLEMELLDKITKNGKMKVTKLTDQEREAFKQAVQPVFDKWAAEMDPEVIKLAKEASN